MPDSELIIVQTEPTIARGWPDAVGPPGGITVMVPLSGTPAIPGASTTAHPIVTGNPGMVFLSLHQAAAKSICR